MNSGVYAKVNGEWELIADKVETVALSVNQETRVLTITVNGVSGTVELN